MAKGPGRRIRPPVGSPPRAQPHPGEAQVPAGPPATPEGEPPSPPNLSPRQILINNEQVKLTANITNAVAAGFIIGGGASAYATFGASSDVASSAGAIGRALVWIGVGAFIHWVARRLLRNLL